MTIDTISEQTITKTKHENPGQPRAKQKNKTNYR
jgi:hypothetical protein